VRKIQNDLTQKALFASHRYRHFKQHFSVIIIIIIIIIIIVAALL
jgi:hypothetical protein